MIEQLVRDAAAKHGQIRVFAAETLLRVDDEPLRITLLRDKRLAALGLAEVQPGLLGSSKKPAEVMAALRSAGHAPVGPADKPRKLPAGRQSSRSAGGSATPTRLRSWRTSEAWAVPLPSRAST